MFRFPAKILAALSVLLLAATPSFAQSAGPLVLAAASLQESLNAAADKWAAKGHPRPVLSFAASSALARQVEAGAKADLFISADEEWMNYLAGKNLLKPGTRVSFLTNSLVLIAPAGSKTTITIKRGFPLAQALGNGRLAMADPDSVPAGKYGKEALANLGVWPSVSGKIARAENVRAALALVSRGEAPLGIVYATDAKAERGVKVAGVFPASSHTPITYPVATLRASTHRDAEGFRRFLISGEGKAIFRTFGFGARADRMGQLSAEEWGIVALTLKVGIVAVIATMPIAFGLAYLLARGRFPGKVLLDAVIHLPLVVPPVVTGWLLLLAFGANGPAGRFFEQTFGITFMFRWTGAALASAVMALPLMVRAIRLSIEAVDRRLEAASRTLGAGPWRTFFSITMPLAMPGVLAGAVLGFARSIGEFGATITFVSNIPGETQTLPLAIYSALQLPGGDAHVLRLAVVSVILSLIALVASEALARRAGYGKGGHVL